MPLTANSASIAGLAATIRGGELTIANRAASPSQSAGASRGSKAAAFSRDSTAGSGADDGGQWVNAALVNVNATGASGGASRRRLALIVSESLTLFSRFHHGAGAGD
jgi:hypothetical protein